MPAKMITLKIDSTPVTVPEGTMVVDAAMKIGNQIPVFCYHPKMRPVGMCRMCLVDIARPVIDRATGQPVLEADGNPKMQFGSKLETACTTPVSEGMLVVTASEKVKAARKDVVEFLLTSHPLDCPVCDKGGECPLQNLTMAHGVGQSRFVFAEKSHAQKHVRLGELIWLDRERCIQCGRCVRFQHEVVDDPVINFFNRGRALEIITDSEPGFASIFSGNTTDICPVGALTTADFHFGARPWEMNASASICNQCAVGCNIVHNVRREAKSGGRTVIKRVMPRQNESVNEIWMCDKGRFTYHYTESEKRLSTPLIRKGDTLEEATWDEALELVAEKFKSAGSSLLTLAGGRLSNEDLFNIRQLNPTGTNRMYSSMAGGEHTTQSGMVPGSNFSLMGKGTTILVVACDLHEEAPVWWLRVKQAAERGATVINVNPRATRLDKVASHTVRYAYGEEATTMALFMPEKVAEANETLHKAAEAFSQAENAVILYGSEGLSLEGSAALAQACADLLQRTRHIERPNNGLIGVWPNGNTQGAWELGFSTSSELSSELGKSLAVLVAGADPAGDDLGLAMALERSAFVVVQDLFLTETANLADVVLPALPYTEREGSITSGERRVQRYYPAVPARPGAKADFVITAAIAHKMGLTVEGRAASLVMAQIAKSNPVFEGLSYQTLAEAPEQFPVVGRNDVYYGGTSYENSQGIGVQLPLATAREIAKAHAPETVKTGSGQVLVVPVTKLYDLGQTVLPSSLLAQRLAQPVLTLNPQTAAAVKINADQIVMFELNGRHILVGIRLDETVPQGMALLPRSVNVPFNQPLAVELKVEEAAHSGAVTKE